MRQPQLAACCRCSANNNKEKTTTTAVEAATDTKEKTKPTKTTVCDIVTRRFVPVLQCLQAFGPIIHEFTGRTSHALSIDSFLLLEIVFEITNTSAVFLLHFTYYRNKLTLTTTLEWKVLRFHNENWRMNIKSRVCIWFETRMYGSQIDFSSVVFWVKRIKINCAPILTYAKNEDIL